jgi:hypothetical protein
MVGNIILSFSTLASAFRLKAPLPPYLPPAEASRQRLVCRKGELTRAEAYTFLLYSRSRPSETWTLCGTAKSKGPASYCSLHMRSR